MFRLLCGRWLLVIALSMCGAAMAETPDENEQPHTSAIKNSLTLIEARHRVDAGNVRLKAGAASVSAAAAERDQAATISNPELSLALENVAGSGAYAGSDSAEATVAISQTFARAARRADVARADAQLSLTQDAQAQEKLTLQAETTRRFVTVLAAQEKLALAQRAEKLAAETRDDLERRAAAARAPLAERNRARMAAQRAKLARQQAEQALALARRLLASLWGAGEADFMRVEGDLFALPAARSEAEWRTALAQSPAYTVLRNGERVRAAELAQARAAGRPPLTASVGLRNFAGTDDNALLVGVSLPIPLFDRNRGGVAAATARLDVQRAENALAQREAELRLDDLLASLRQTREETHALHDEALPLAHEALAQTHYGYERGRFSWLELASAQQELIDTEHAAIEAAAHYHALLADLEALTGLAATDASVNAGVQP